MTYLDVGKPEEAPVAIQEELDLWGSQPVRILLTIKQTAQVLSLSRSTVYELIRDCLKSFT